MDGFWPFGKGNGFVGKTRWVGKATEVVVAVLASICFARQGGFNKAEERLSSQDRLGKTKKVVVAVLARGGGGCDC